MSNQEKELEGLEKLSAKKDEIFKAERVAWLHDWEKCSDKHINDSVRFRDSSNNTNYNISNPVKAEMFIELLEHLTLQLPGMDQPISFKYLIENGRPHLLEDFLESGQSIDNKETYWACLALGACHSAAHTEKELAIHLLKQLALESSYGSSPFGYETRQLTNLSQQFDKLPFDHMNDYSFFKADLKSAFSYACGDTRRPINDVSLWDWSYMTAALYKAAVAEYVIMGLKDPSQLKWRLLSIRFDGIAFIAKANRIPDLLGRKKLIEDGLNRVRNLLEEVYPLGTEVYRDENGSVFLVPDMENLLTLTNEQGKMLSSRIIDVFNPEIDSSQDSPDLDIELLPFLELGASWEWDFDPQKKTKHHPPLPIGKHLLKNPPLQSKPSIVATWWQNYVNDICAVCQLRPQGWGASDNKAHYQRQARREKCPTEPYCRTCRSIERKICAVCEQRREKNFKRWIGLLNTTIWLDEMADTSGKLAIITGQLGLQDWLNGKLVFYPPNQGIDDSAIDAAFKIKTLEKTLNDGEKVSIFSKDDCFWNQKLGVLVTSKIRRQSPPRLRSRELKTHQGLSLSAKDVDLLPNGQYRITLEKPIPQLIPENKLYIYGQEFLVSEDRTSVDTVNSSTKEKIRNILLYDKHFILDKYFVIPKTVNQPSQMIEAEAPARLYRVWETTRLFWQSIGDELDHQVETISSRLRIRGEFETRRDVSNKLLKFHTYELKLSNVNLSIACTDEGEFLIVDNLRRTANLLNQTNKYAQDHAQAVKDLQEYLSGKSFPVEMPTGYGGPNKPLGTLHVLSVTSEDTPYVPAIPILSEPRTFMALVPADKALDVVKAIKEKYTTEIGKVRNRLPLTLGIVFAGMRTPLPAILDAGRRMLQQPVESELWKVEHIDKSAWPEHVTLTLQRVKQAQDQGQRPQDEQTLTLKKISTIMGDKMTEDVWYPYWQLEKGASNAGQRARLFKGMDGKDWVHIHDLYKGDIVSFMPSHLDFELLDTAARRFEISYANGKRRSPVHPARPYYLEQLDDLTELWEILSNKTSGLATSQIHNLVGLVETKRMEWQANQNNPIAKETFKKTVRQIIANAGWRSRLDTPCLDRLQQAAISGQLTDVVELYMSILDEGNTQQEGENK